MPNNYSGPCSTLSNLAKIDCELALCADTKAKLDIEKHRNYVNSCAPDPTLAWLNLAIKELELISMVIKYVKDVPKLALEALKIYLNQIKDDYKAKKIKKEQFEILDIMVRELDNDIRAAIASAEKCMPELKSLWDCSSEIEPRKLTFKLVVSGKGISGIYVKLKKPWVFTFSASTDLVLKSSKPKSTAPDDLFDHLVSNQNLDFSYGGELDIEARFNKPKFISPEPRQFTVKDVKVGNLSQKLRLPIRINWSRFTPGEAQAEVYTQALMNDHKTVDFEIILFDEQLKNDPECKNHYLPAKIPFTYLDLSFCFLHSLLNVLEGGYLLSGFSYKVGKGQFIKKNVKICSIPLGLCSLNDVEISCEILIKN